MFAACLTILQPQIPVAKRMHFSQKCCKRKHQLSSRREGTSSSSQKNLQMRVGLADDNVLAVTVRHALPCPAVKSNKNNTNNKPSTSFTSFEMCPRTHSKQTRIPIPSYPIISHHLLLQKSPPFQLKNRKQGTWSHGRF